MLFYAGLLPSPSSISLLPLTLKKNSSDLGESHPWHGWVPTVATLLVYNVTVGIGIEVLILLRACISSLQ